MEHKRYRSLPDIRLSNSAESDFSFTSFDDHFKDSNSLCNSPKSKRKVGLSSNALSEQCITIRSMMIEIEGQIMSITVEDTGLSMSDCLRKRDNYIIFKFYCEKVIHSRELCLFVEELDRYKNSFESNIYIERFGYSIKSIRCS